MTEDEELKIEFQGYTWDEYFYVISEKRGVLITYSGSLDCEGALKMGEIIFIEGAERLGQIYEGNLMQEIRKAVYETGNKLFFSYAETDENYSVIATNLIDIIQPRFNKKKGLIEKKMALCKGACALFPYIIISKE